MARGDDVERDRADAALLAATRAGDADAYAVLWRRHRIAARAAARALVRSHPGADQVVSIAFARQLTSLQEGSGPELAFRPALLATVRDVAVERPDPRVPRAELLELTEDQEVAGRAFAALPERWRSALWHGDVEGAAPAEVALFSGTAADAVPALTFRAREGLRDAIVLEQLGREQDEECRPVIAQLGAHARDALDPAARAVVDEHLATCATCPAVAASLAVDADRLRATLVPGVVGVPAAAYLAGLGSGDVVTMLWRGPRRTRFAAAAAVAVIALATAGALIAGARDNDLAFAKAATAQLADDLVPSTVPDPTPPATLPTTVPPTSPPTTAIFVPPPVDTAPSTGTTVAEPTTTRATVPTRATTRTTVRPTTTPKPTTTTAAPETTLPAFTFAVEFDGVVRAGAPAAASSWAPPPARRASRAGDVPLSATFTMRATNTSPADAPGLTVQFLVPPPVRWVSANPDAFGCTADGAVLTCVSNGPVVKGSVATLVLGFADAPALGFSLTPSIAAPHGARLTGPGVFTFPATSATDGFAVVTTRGAAAVVVSPPIAQCAEPCSTDAPPTTASGGPVPLDVTGTVRAAYLAWWAAGEVPSVAPRVTLTTGNSSAAISASIVRAAATTVPAHVALADVTAAVRGSGNVTVEGNESSPVSGWALVVVTADQGAAPRVVRVDTPAVPSAGGQFDAFVVGGAAQYSNKFPAGDISVVAFGNADSGDRVTPGGGATVVDPFTSDPGRWSAASFDGGALGVSTEGRPFVLALVVSSSPAPG